MFKTFTGCEYLMIDAATQFGLDKKTFEERIQWTKFNLNHLENLLPQAKEKPLYQKAVNTIRQVQEGLPTGHMVGLDASSSGLQIMSAVMGCKTGALHTGLVDPNTMPDAYTTCTNYLQDIVGQVIDVERDDAKQALMTYFYGSEAKPKQIFVEGSEAYQAFFKAAQMTAPEAYDLRNILIDIWNPNALMHSWIMPDGFDVRIKVMVSNSKEIKVPELNSSFTHIFIENQPTDFGLSLAANSIHSIDGMIVREMNRRCNYNSAQLFKALDILDSDKRKRIHSSQWNKTTMVLASHINQVNKQSIKSWSLETISRVEALIYSILQNQPFDLIAVHDEFKAHANHMNTVRYWYKELLAELADSHIMQFIIRQICKNDKLKLHRASEDLGKYIRNSNYALG